MARLKAVTAALVVVGLLASVCDAQEQGRRRGGRGFGFGGFGQGGSAGLLAMGEVRTELKVEGEQGTKLDALLQDARDKLSGGFNFQDLQNLSEADRQAKLDEFRVKAEEVAKETEAKLAEILTPDQMKRLGELRLQREGVNALARPDVATAMGLSEEQQKQIKDIQEAARPQPGQGGRNFQNLTDEERQKLFAEMQARREKTEADLMAVLTDEQKVKLTEMKGAEFQFPQGGQGGGRNRGPRQRPPRSPGA